MEEIDPIEIPLEIDEIAVSGGDCKLPQKIPQKPGAVKRVVNFTKAGVRHFVTGGKKATPELQAERLATCMSCPLFVDGGCLKCGCPIKRKIKWASSHCPEGKW